jgi:hypothetical protein
MERADARDLQPTFFVMTREAANKPFLATADRRAWTPPLGDKMMKTGTAIGILLCLASPLLAEDLPPIPRAMKDYHYASDTNVTAEVGKAIQSAVAALRTDGRRNLDGTDGYGVIYRVQKKDPGYWVMCQNYSVSKNGTLSPVVGGYVWVVLDGEFRFKEFKRGA